MQPQQFKDILQNPYNTNRWLSVLNYVAANKSHRLKDTINPFDRTKSLSKTDRNIFKKLLQIGTFVTSEGDRMPIFEVTLTDNVRIDRNRVQVNEIIKKVILTDAIKAALCVFYYENKEKKPEWRFSFISKFAGSDFFDELETQETNPKRFTYIFGTKEQHRTARQRFQALRESNFTVDDFFEAFAIEGLSKEFFYKYRDEHYQKFVDYLNKKPNSKTFFINNKDGKEIRDFVKKMLGRIVFLYFVQKKGWLGATSLEYDDGDLNFMENYFLESGENDDFYPNYLTKLFFETLNAQRDDDEFEMPDGETVKIPYLNGGLFENENELYNSLTFPPLLFQNLFSFLNEYNFTVYENSPDDHVVAVDPEMLGNIFENLLEDNKDKGAFYTPKEIVQYMCQQSLIEYLATQLVEQNHQVTSSHLMIKQRIEAFVQQKNQKSAAAIQQYAAAINQALDKVKICDPAIGSGAFPMGLLQEIFDLKVALHQLLKIKIVDTTTDFDDMFAAVKANIIQNSIYGVDIEKGAVDIARLRFWLSLVVDEKTPKALPNLDYKIMQGDSLLESFEGFDLSVRMDERSRLNSAFSTSQLEYIQQLTKRYFNLGKTEKQYAFSIAEQKAELKEEIETEVFSIVEGLIKGKKQRLENEIDEITSFLNQLNKTLHKSRTIKQKRDKEKAIAKNSKRLNIISKLLKDLELRADNLRKAHKNNERPYFLWSVYFYDVVQNGGFDIIIGNPPYIQLQRDKGYLANLYKNEKFDTFARSGDIYALFYEKGFDLLKENGVHTFITSNKWMRANYGKSLRKYLALQNPIRLLDLGPGVFPNATVDTNIIITKKGKNQKQLQSITIDKRQEINSLRENDFVKMPNVNQDIWIVLNATELKIKNQIEKVGTPLKDWDVEINYGIKTGYNEAFIIDTRKRNELVNADPKSAEIIKKMLKGRNIERYKANWSNLWLISTFPAKNIDINDFSAVKAHLENYLPKLKQIGESFI
ncbi:MAG: N-6 DNA methylase, partial [Saprospiraceae bacterium]